MEEKTRHWIVLAAEWTRLDSPARPMRGRGGEGKPGTGSHRQLEWSCLDFLSSPQEWPASPPQFLLGSEMGSKARTGFPCWLECTEWGQGSPLPLSLPPSSFTPSIMGPWY